MKIVTTDKTNIEKKRPKRCSIRECKGCKREYTIEELENDPNFVFRLPFYIFCSTKCISVERLWSKNYLMFLIQPNRIDIEKGLNRAGKFYYIRSSVNDALKIGFAKDENRIKSYDTHSPVKLEVHLKDGNWLSERTAIFNFKMILRDFVIKNNPNGDCFDLNEEYQKRFRGEWFYFTDIPEILDFAEKFYHNDIFRKKKINEYIKIVQELQLKEDGRKAA